jgi:hypothetical protein
MNSLRKHPSFRPQLLLNFLLIVICFGFLFSAIDARAAQITLGWDENSDSNLAGYRIYYRACDSCTSMGDKSTLTQINIPLHQLDDASQPRYCITNLATGTRYLFAATAYTSSGQESEFSNAVEYNTATVNGNQAPVVNAGADKSVALASNDLTLTGTVTDDGLPANGNLIVEWYKYSGPGTVTFGSPLNETTTARFSAAGTYQIRLEADDGDRIAYDTVTVDVTDSSNTNTAAPTVIVDNRNTAKTAKTGTWQVSGASNPYGSDSVYSRNGATFTWKYTPAKSGTHDVSMWWTYVKSRSTRIPVTINYASGKKVVYINQQQNAGKWFSLGRFKFLAGKTYNITITAPSSTATTCADAVGFKFISAN